MTVKHCCKWFLYIVGCVVVFLLVGEGYLAWKDHLPNITYQGRHHGDYLLDVERFHTENRPCVPETKPIRAKKHFLVQGCSFTYGLGVDPEDTFCWKLNEMQDDILFHNHAIPGKGVGTALLDLPYQLKQRQYDAVLFATIANHIKREGDMRVISDIEAPVLREQAKQRFLRERECPIFLNGGMHRLWLFWLQRLWPYEEQSRLITFAHQVWIYKCASQTIADGDETSIEEKRFRYNIRAMYTVCKQQGIPFAIIELFGYNSKMVENVNLRYRAAPLEYYVDRPLTKDDVVPSIPIIKAEYPEDYMSRPELHTDGTNVRSPDSGDHPSPLVHTYYAEKILSGVKALEKAGQL